MSTPLFACVPRAMPGSLVKFLTVAGVAAMLLAPRAQALNPTEKPRDYIVAHWDTENGLPHNSIKQIFQTRDGYLWLGTNYGLVRFDGLTFTVYNHSNTPQIPHNQITSMAETADGSLWFGTAGGLVRHRKGEFTKYGVSDGVRNIVVNTVCTMPDGSLWIGGREGITRWVDGKFVNDVDLSGYDTAALRNIYVARNKDVWITAGGALLRHRDGKFTAFGPVQGLATERVERIREDAEGQIFAITQNGAFRLKDDRFTPFEHNYELSSIRGTSLLFDRAGNLWIGSNGGLDRYSQGKVTAYSDRYGQRLGVVDALFEDREGCLWIGTADGLCRLTDRRVYTLTAPDGTQSGAVTSVLEARDGSLWIGSWGRGADRWGADGQISHFVKKAPLSHDTVTRIYEDNSGVMWIGTRGSSLDRLENGKVTTYIYQSGVSTSRPVTALLRDEDGTMLIGIDKRGLLQLSNGQILPVPELATWAEQWANAPVTVWSLYRTHDGRLLMGTTLGLYERRPDRKWQPLTLPGLNGTPIVRDIFEGADGTFWLATEGMGLVRWKDGSARAFGSAQGLLDDTIFSVLEDEQGSLWVCSARGIARIRKTEFTEIDRGTNARLKCIRFGRVDGLESSSSPGTGGPAAIRRADGRLVFATGQGAAVVDLHTLQLNDLPPTVMLERMTSDDQPVKLDNTISLGAGTNKVEFRYTALSLIAPEQLRFRYMLEGSDRTWVDETPERVARYTRLPPGKYTFRVIACNNDGTWNETGVNVAFAILPHFYQTLWFRIGAVVFLGVIIYTGVALRIRQLNRRQLQLKRTNQELDRRVRERTTELWRSNEELRQREMLFRLIFEHAPVGISWKRADQSDIHHFNSTFRRILNLPAETLPDYSLLTRSLHPDDARRQAERQRDLEAGKTDSYTVEQRFVFEEGRTVWGLLSVAVIRDEKGRIVQDIGILEEITARKHAEIELANTYKSLVGASRLAGMAEVATGVLHNVGNVLNSLNVSATVIATGLRQSKTESFSKVTQLLRERNGDLGRFLTEDAKGKLVPEFLESLAIHFTDQRNQLIRELASMQKNIDHIKDIVTMQQTYATAVGMLESLDPFELIEDALRMNTAALARHDVTVVREYQPVPKVHVEKGKVLQILINLIRNAKYACDDAFPDGAQSGEKKIIVRIQLAAEGFVQLIVADNGIGIAEENLTRIFSHGFTTRAYGHGFGLHSAALAAKEMKGSLVVHSDGLGKGATFTLTLPIAVKEEIKLAAALAS